MTTPLAMVSAAGNAAPSRREEMSAEPDVSTRLNRLRFAVLATPLVGVTILSKFSVPPLGEQGIGLSLLFMCGALIVGSISNCVRLDPRRLALYVMLIGFLGLVQILQPDLFSISSMLLLTAL